MKLGLKARTTKYAALLCKMCMGEWAASFSRTSKPFWMFALCERKRVDSYESEVRPAARTQDVAAASYAWSCAFGVARKTADWSSGLREMIGACSCVRL